MVLDLNVHRETSHTWGGHNWCSQVGTVVNIHESESMDWFSEQKWSQIGQDIREVVLDENGQSCSAW